MAEPAPSIEGKKEEPSIGTLANVVVWRDSEDGFAPLGATSETTDHPEDGRTPAFRRHCWTNLPIAWDVPQDAEKPIVQKIPNTIAVSRCKERIEQQVCFNSGWLRQMVWQAILEETYEAWATGASTVSFVAASVLSRILHGISYAWRPNNSRTAADRETRKTALGGKVADWLELQVQIVRTEENPYLYADPNAMIEWLSRKGRPSAHMVNEALELMLIEDELPALSSLDRRILDELLGEAHKYRVTQNKQNYGLVAVKEEDAKAWAEKRQAQLESSYYCPDGPSWMEQAKEKLPKPADTMIPKEVLQVATTVGRRARATRNIYYGTESSYSTPKQLQEAILKLITEQGPQTCRLISNQLEVSMTRIKTALARLVWNSRQVIEYRVFETMDRHNLGMNYAQQVKQTEIHLRRLILDALIGVPPHRLSIAGDDNDEDNTIPEGWQETGHPWIHTRIVRPAVLQHETMLLEYVITGYAPAERNQEGELIRRTRFRATPEEDGPTVSLTDAQVWAGQHAYKERLKSNYEFHHPMAQANEIALISGTSNQSIFGRVVGHDSIEEADGSMQHKILILPNGENTALWATLVGSTVCIVDDREYSLRLSEYQKDSTAYLECMGIIKYMQRHANGGPFLQPVDPVALGVPNYLDVVKQPMDISTVLKKLQEGSYSNPRPVDRNPVVCMLRGPFRDDVSLIFDNAMLFNPPDDWIYQAALVLKKQVMQKIDQVCRSVSSEQQSVYIDDEFSDEDIVVAAGSRKRKRRTKEDQAGAVVAEAVRVDALKSRLPISPRVTEFSIDSSKWKCQSKSHSELDELRLLYQQRSDNSRSRRTTRKQQVGDGASLDLEYYFDDMRANNRLQLELAQESRHERIVKSLDEEDPSYANGMPPYLGRVVAGKWEIRSECLEEALKWVLRGLSATEHIVLEEGWIAPNNIYYADDSVEPFETIDKKLKKAADPQHEESDEEVELSAYEQARKDKVARNTERLKELGLLTDKS